MEKSQLNDWIKWGVATILAAITMAITGLSYMESRFYSAAQGTDLKTQVVRDEDKLDKQLQMINKKLDDLQAIIYRIDSKVNK